MRPIMKSRPIEGRLQTTNQRSVDDGRGRTGTAQDPDQRDDTPADEQVDNDRDDRLGLEDRAADLVRVEDPMEWGDERPGQVVHEADEGSRIRAEHLEQEANRDQRIDQSDDPPDDLDRSVVVATTLAVHRRTRGGRRYRRDGAHRVARRLLSDDLTIV